MIVENSYYSIACNELHYLEWGLRSPFYNSIAAQAQQVAEKMIKSVAELVCVDIEKLMTSHNLRGLYDAIHRIEPSFVFDRNRLSTLKDYYYDARYPGDNFVTVTKEECMDAVHTMYDVVKLVNDWRKEHEYSIEEITDKTFLVGSTDAPSSVNSF